MRNRFGSNAYKFGLFGANCAGGMTLSAAPAVRLALVAACCFSTAPWAEGFDPEGDPILEYQGPSFFGFVKDTNGAFVPGATVKFAAKGRDAVTARTNSIGVYRVSLGKDVDANDVVLSCEKAGFKQVRVVRRTERDASPQTPIEIECILVADAAR
jgi:hypothetical protein